jgi:V/A-type H+-transporting ATPase subunit F
VSLIEHLLVSLLLLMSTNNNEYRIAIIGPSDVVSGFRALGVEAFDAASGATALERLRTLKAETDRPYAVVCLIEELFTDVDPAEFQKATAGALPAVVLLPGPSGSTGLALARLRRLAEKAVGSAII